MTPAPLTSTTQRRTQAERSETTTAELLERARDLFAENGYASTAVDEIVQSAGVTRGALYHHFPGKLEIFRAVYIAEERRLAEAIVERTALARNAWDRFRQGCRGFLAEALDPHVRQIVLLDAPSVLGWDAVRAIEAETTTALLRLALEDAAAAGFLRRGHAEARAALLTGALCDAAMFVARAEDQAAALRTTTKEFDLLLSGFRRPMRTASS